MGENLVGFLGVTAFPGDSMSLDGPIWPPVAKDSSSGKNQSQVVLPQGDMMGNKASIPNRRFYGNLATTERIPVSWNF